MKNGARCPDRIKAPNHPAGTMRKPPKPETRGSNPRGPATPLVFILSLQTIYPADRMDIVDGLRNYFAFIFIASTEQLDLHFKQAEQLPGFVTIGWSSNHSITPKVHDSTHFLQLMQRR